VHIHSLTARFLLTLLLSTAVPFLVFGWFVRQEVEGQLEATRVNVDLPKQAADVAESIAKRLRGLEQVCGVLFPDAKEALATSHRAGLEKWLDITGLRETLDLLLLVDAAGKVVGYYPNPALDQNTKAARDALRPHSVAGLAWFGEISSGRTGRVWEPPHVSVFLHGLSEEVSRDPSDYSLGLALSVPTEERNRYGALYALVRWQEVQKVLDDAVTFAREKRDLKSAEMFLCDGEGVCLAHTERKSYGHQLVEDGSLWQAIVDDQNRNARFRTVVGEERWLGHAAVEGPLDWRVCFHASSADLFETSRAFGRNLLVITALTAFILMIWAMLASRAIVRPVRRLAQATESVARGDLTARVPAKGAHELAELGRAFNHMAEDLETNHEKLKDAERQAAWAEMARQVAHEIKNPLTPMRMSAQLLERAKREGDPRISELIDRLTKVVLDQTTALDRIASQFRQFAGPPVRKVERVAADDLLGDVETDLFGISAAGETEIVFAPGAEDSLVEVDREELRRVFLNLVQNSIAACDGGGRIELTSLVDGPDVIFRITDDGPGISPELRGKLFNPYFTTRSSGTGLGLAICRRIMQAHKGTITLEVSRPGLTTFRLLLPRA